MMSELESKPEHNRTGGLDAQSTSPPTVTVATTYTGPVHSVIVFEKREKKLCKSCFGYIHQNVGRNCTEEYGVRHVMIEDPLKQSECECSCGCARIPYWSE